MKRNSIQRYYRTKTSTVRISLIGLVLAGCVCALGQEAATESDESSAMGFEVPVAMPIDDAAEKRAIAAIRAIAASKTSDVSRRTVVLRFAASADETSTASTSFERALGLSRFLISDDCKQLRFVAFLKTNVRGHNVLPVLACDQIAVASTAGLGAVGASEQSLQLGEAAIYRSIAERRRTVPSAVIDAMLDRDLELARVTTIDGKSRFLSGESLREVRDAGEVTDEQIIAAQDELAEFSAAELREYRWAAFEADDLESLAATLKFDAIQPLEQVSVGERKALLANIQGPINGKRVARLLNNLTDAVKRHQVNQIVVQVGSAGGSLPQSARVAGKLNDLLQSDFVQSASFVPERALGDAALIALSARRVYMAPQARIGGPGAASFDTRTLEGLREQIDQIARGVGRSPAIVQGLLDPQVEVHKYVDSRTGRSSYYASDNLPEGEAFANLTQGERIDLSQGLTAEEALSIGLIDGIEPSLLEMSKQIGLAVVPPEIEERWIIRTVERLGREAWVSRTLLFIGFFTLMVEAGAPGIGVPGFVSLVSLMLFFWIQVVGGTAEWLELLLFCGGIVCLFAEFFLIPGFGVFGIGGMVMVVMSLILVSQTFVVPTNSYQYAEMTDSLARVLSGFIGIAGGVVALRWLAPQVPFFRHLVIIPDEEENRVRDASEALVHWNHLLGERGTTTTPLVPAGKARFGNELVAVISDGPMIDTGQSISVIEVVGNRILVEACQDERASS